MRPIYFFVFRYLKKAKYPHNICISPLFESSKAALGSRKKELKADGKGNHPNRAEEITKDMIDLMWESGELGDHTGRVLQNTLFFYLTIGFGFRACHESKQMEWGDVTLNVDHNGTEFLQFRERLSKTNQSGSGHRPFAPKIFAMGGSRCPILLYKKYTALRPKSFCHEDSAFYLTPKPDKFCKKKCWYAAMPMGKSTIAKIVPTMAWQKEVV